MRTIHRLVIGLTLLSIVGVMACGKKKPTGSGNEEELITTVILRVTEQGTTTTTAASFTDLDGPGATAPAIDTLVIQAGKVYGCEVSFLDESKTPSEDITEEVKEEAEAHQVFYTRAGLGASVMTYEDKESDYGPQSGTDHPVGIKTRLVVATGITGIGSMRILLSHYTDIAKTGENLSTETDVDVTFPVKIVP